MESIEEIEHFEEQTPPVRSSFRNSKWSNSALLGGLLILLIYILISTMKEGDYQQLPYFLQVIIYLTIPDLFFILYPLITREQDEPNRTVFPTIKLLITESVIVVPLVIGCYVLNIGIANLVYHFTGQNYFTTGYENYFLEDPFSSYSILLLVTISFYGPITEELFFRGFLFNAFQSRMRWIYALVLQAAIFSAIHTYNIYYVISIFPMGIIFGLLYSWRKTIYSPILLHIGYNSLMVCLMIYSGINYPSRAVLGVSPETKSAPCVVQTITPNSPAEAAGIQPNDVIVEFDIYEIRNFEDLQNATYYYKPGDKVLIKLIRNDEELVVEATLISAVELQQNQQRN